MDKMSIKQEPFKAYHENKQADTFTVRLRPDERARLELSKKLLEQTKDSTALKQLALIGHFVLHSNQTSAIIQAVFINKRRNKDRGIVDFD